MILTAGERATLESVCLEREPASAIVMSTEIKLYELLRLAKLGLVKLSVEATEAGRKVAEERP